MFGELPAWQCRSTAHPTGTRGHANDARNPSGRADNAHPSRATYDAPWLCPHATAFQWPASASLPPRPWPHVRMEGHRCGCPHPPCRGAPTLTRGRPDSENARPADANRDTSTGRLAPYGHTGRTADSGRTRSCGPSGQPLRQSHLRSISAWWTSLHWRTPCTRYRDTTKIFKQPLSLCLHDGLRAPCSYRLFLLHTINQTPR
jgi:hypothetical protein